MSQQIYIYIMCVCEYIYIQKMNVRWIRNLNIKLKLCSFYKKAEKSD